MKRPSLPLRTLAGLLVGLLSVGASADLDPRLRGCYDTFLQCIDAIPEQGSDGRYPVAREKRCELAYRNCKIQLGFPADAGLPRPQNDTRLPDYD
ncbi:hypothetical protein [Endothiovibrio diazotrophicus]